MALSYVEYPSSGSTKAFDLTFGYLSRTHVFAFVNDTLAAYTWVSPTRIELVNIPPENATIKIARLTDRVTRITSFADGQTLLSGDLNAGDLQNFYILQEIADGVADGVVAGTIVVQNPGTGYITEQWIQQQLQAAVGGSDALADLNTLIDQEVTARNAAILAEQQARAAALVTEANARIAVADNLAAELLARAQGDATEAAARALVAQDLAAELLARAQGDAAEAAARAVVAQNLAAETTARTQAIASEAAARATAVQAEATARADSVLALTQADVGLGQRLTTVESDINTATTGLKAKVATLTTTTTDLANNKADASVVTAIDAKIETPTTGLKARATSLESRTTAVETGKASVASVSAIDAKIETPTTGLLARATSLESRVSTVETGKASTTVTDALSSEINTPTTGLKARATSLESRVTTVETDKASASALTALTSRVTTAEADIDAVEAVNVTQGNRLTTAESGITTLNTTTANLATNKADASTVTTLSATVTTVSGVANSKAKTFRQTAAPTAGMQDGDLWIDSDDGNKLYMSVTGVWTAVDDARVATTAANLVTESSARVSADNAQVSRLNSLEATVNTPTTGLSARVTSSETAITDLTTNKASVSSVSAIDAKIETPTTGLLARATSLEGRVSTVETGKASTTVTDAISAELNTPTTGLKARATSLESRVTTVETDKATVSSVSAVDAKIETPTTGLKARATSLETRVSTVETGKASTSVTDTLSADLNTPTTGLKARATSLESRVSTVETGKAATTVTDAIDAKIETPTTGLKARASSLESRVTSVETDKAATTVTDAIDAKIETPTTGLKARATSLETRVTSVETGKAATTVTDAIDAKIETPTTGLKARATSLESRTTAVETNKADASTVTALTARVASGDATGLIRNSRFAEPLVSGLPPGWYNWSNGTGTAVPRWIHTAGNAFRLVGPVNAGGGLQAGTFPVNSIRGGSRFRVLIEAVLVSGTYDGAGIFIDWRDASSVALTPDVRIGLANTPDTSGVTSNSAAGFRAWDVEVTAPANAVRANFYVMSHWSNHSGGQAVANSIDWHLVDLVPTSSRLSSAESNITSLQTTTANLNTGKAEASTVTALTSRVSNAAGGMGTVSDFAADGLHWATNFGGSPGTIADAANGATYVNVAGIGRCMEINTYPFYLTPKAAFKPVIGRRYRITVRFAAGTDATGGNLNVAINNVNGLTELWAHGVPNSTAFAVPGVPASATVTVAEGFKTISREWGVTSLGTYDAAWRLRIDVTRSAGSGGTVRIADFRVEDVTDVLAATARGAAAAGSGLVKNSLFQVPFSGTQIPPDWASFANGTGTQVDRVSGTGKAYRLVSTAGLQSGNQQAIPDGSLKPGRYTMRVKLRRVAGNLDGAAAYLACDNSAGASMGAFQWFLATTKNTAGETRTDPDGITTWELPVTAPAGTTRGTIFFMNHFSPAGSIAATNTIDWYEVDLIPATDADTRVAVAEANITNLQSTTVNLQSGKAEASTVSSLTATVNTNAVKATDVGVNLIPNSTGMRGVTNWQGATTWATYYHPLWGDWFSRTFAGQTVTEEFYTAPIPAIAGEQYSMGFVPYVAGITSGLARVLVGFYNSAGTYIGESASVSLTPAVHRVRQTVEAIAAPAGTASMRFVIAFSGVVGNGGYAEVGFWQAKIEPGIRATAWRADGELISNLARTSTAEANITTLQSTTVDLQNNKASATELTSLKASVTPRIGQVTGSLLVNPAFSDYPVASGSVPPGWTDWANGATSSRGTGKVGLYAHIRDGNAAADSGIYQQRPITPGKYIMKCTIERSAGTLTSAGVYLEFRNSGGTILADKAFAFELTPDTRGSVGVNVGYDYRQFERPFTVPANTTTINVFLMNHWGGGFGSNAVYNQIYWHQLDIVSADYGTAEVDILKAALATENSSEARVLIKVNTGTNVASFEGLAQSGDGVWNGSAINLTADKIKLQGDVIVTGTLTANEVQSNSLTKSAADVKTTSQSVTTTYADLQSITLNVPTGASLVKLDWAMRIDGRSLNATPCQTVVRVLRDGTDITGDIVMSELEGVTTFDLFYGGTRSASDYVEVEYVVNGSFAAFALDVGASAGNRVYTLQVKKDTAGATYTVRRSTFFGVGHAR